MGVIPLVRSVGAGAEMRQSMGVAVFAGMLGVTFFGLLLTPVFYVAIRGFIERKRSPAESTTPEHAAPAVGKVSSDPANA
jgi:multidrug efflux pump